MGHREPRTSSRDRPRLCGTAALIATLQCQPPPSAHPRSAARSTPSGCASPAQTHGPAQGGRRQEAARGKQWWAREVHATARDSAAFGTDSAALQLLLRPTAAAPPAHLVRRALAGRLDSHHGVQGASHRAAEDDCAGDSSHTHAGQLMQQAMSMRNSSSQPQQHHPPCRPSRSPCFRLFLPSAASKLARKSGSRSVAFIASEPMTNCAVRDVWASHFQA